MILSTNILYHIRRHIAQNSISAFVADGAKTLTCK